MPYPTRMSRHALTEAVVRVDAQESSRKAAQKSPKTYAHAHAHADELD